MCGDDVGTLVRTKEEVFGHLRQTDSDYNTFRDDVNRWAQGKKGDDMALVKSFNEFYGRWKEFLTSMQERWYGWGGHVPSSENWRRRLIGWRKVFIHRGMKPTTPDPELEHSQTPHIIPILVATSGAVLGAYITDKILRRKL